MTLNLLDMVLLGFVWFAFGVIIGSSASDWSLRRRFGRWAHNWMLIKQQEVIELDAKLQNREASDAAAVTHALLKSRAEGAAQAFRQIWRRCLPRG